MKNGLQVRPGGFFEIEFFWDNNRCFEEIIGNRPVLRGITRHYNTVGGANSLFQIRPRYGRITIDVRATEWNAIKS